MTTLSIDPDRPSRDRARGPATRRSGRPTRREPRPPRAAPVIRRRGRQLLLRHVPGGEGHHHRRPDPPDHRAHRPVRLRQVDAAADDQPHERPDPRHAGRGRGHVPRPGPVRAVRRPGRGPAADRDGLPEAEPVPEVDLRQRRVRAAAHRLQGRHGRARRAQPAARRALGRGQGQAQAVRPVAVGRPAAAAVHRARDRDRARRHPDGRAVLGARPALDAPDRGADGGAQARTTRSSS